jgi:hypothetical protein
MERGVQWMVLGIVLFVVGIILAFALTIAFAEADSAEGAISSMCIGGIMALIGGVLGFVGFIKWLADRDQPAPAHAQYPYPPPQQQYYQQPYPGQAPPPGYQPPPRSREEEETRRFF